MTYLKKLFTAPVFDNEIKNQQAYLLNIILWTLVCVPIPVVIYSLALDRGASNRILIQAAFGESVNIILLFMLHRGYVKAASIIQVSAFWFFFTATAFTGNGVQGEAYLLGYGLVIAIAGILLGGTGASIFTFMSLAAGAGMVYSQTQGIITSNFDSAPLTTWVVSLVLFPVGAIIQHLASRTLRIALARARASEEKYRLISKVSTDYIFASDVDKQGGTKLVWVTGAFKSMTGYTFEEYINSGEWPAHVHPDDAAKDTQDMETLKRNLDIKSDIRTYTKNGEIRWERIFAHPIWDEKENRLVGIVGAVQDVTERKQADDALRSSEAIYRQAIEVAGAVPYHQTFDENGNIHYDFMSEGIRQITGYGPEEFTDTLWGSLVQERHLLEDLADYSLDDAIDRVRSGKNPIWKCEHCIKARNGKIHWVFEAAVDLRDEHGIAHGSVGLYQDITERKLAEETLKYERDLLQIFMDNIPDTVYFKNMASQFVRINQTQARLLGLDNPQDAIGKTDLDFQNPELAREFLAEEKQILETGQPILNRIEFNPTHDGKPRWLSATKVPVKDGVGHTIGIIGISRDVTEQKNATELEQKRSIMLEKVIQLGKQSAKSDDLRTTIHKIWDGVHNDLGFDRLAIFLFNPEQNSMDDTVGTNNNGEMVEQWDISFPIDSTFAALLQNPNGIYFTHNYDVENKIPEGHEMYGVKDYVAVAAWAGDKPVAVICADHAITHRPITTEQLEALRLFSGHAGLAIENARLNEKIQNELLLQIQAKEREEHRREVLEKVIKLGQRVTEVSDLRTALIKIWQGIHDDLGFDRIGIHLYNPERRSMDGTFGTNYQGEMIDEWDTWFSMEVDNQDSRSFLHVFEKPDILSITHAYENDYTLPEGHIMSGVKDRAAIGAWVGEKPVAVISVDNRVTSRPFADEQLEALRLFAGYPGLAIENARLNELIQRELSQQTQAKEREEHRREILEKVVKLGQRVTEVSDVRTTLMRIWHGIRDDLGFDRIAIHLYNSEHKSMDGTFGTNNQGEMTDEWDTAYSMEQDNSDSNSFLHVFEKSDSFSLTHTFESDYTPPEGHLMSGVKDHAAVGAWSGEKPVAVISVDNRITGRSFAEEQLEALRLFAGYAGLAIENARLNELVQKELSQQTQAKEREGRRREILEKVVTLGQRVTEVYDLRTTLIRIWHGVHDDLGFDRLGIYLYNPERRSMDGTFGTNKEGEMIDEWNTWISMEQDNLESKAFLRVLEKPDNIYLTHTYENNYNPPEGHIMSGVKDFAAIAAWAGEKPVAAICVDHVITGRPITGEQLEALRLFAGYAGLAIENARLNSALQGELIQRKNFIVELEAKNAELERFTYTVSHDLKSPLVTIKGFLGYLEKDAYAGNFEKFQKDVHRIESAVEKMQDLLKDLLELSRIGRLMDKPVAISFNEIVRAALEIMHGQLEAKNVLIEYQNNNVTLFCDQVRMTEVVQNLIDNAIKFMGDQPKPRIEIGTLNNDKSESVVYIKDNGIGIAPEFHEKIFGLFNKLSTDSDGTGIGLSLVKRIIEVHGGRIWVESQVGRGTTFYFTIPASNL